MKLSPFYKAFEAQASSSEARLVDANTLLSLWIEIQRRWVYLEVGPHLLQDSLLLAERL